MNERRAKLIKYLIGVAVCLVIGGSLAWFVASNYGYKEAADEATRYMVLCNAFTIPGVLLTLGAALIAIYNTGFFSGLFYGLRGLKDMFLPFLRQEYVPYRDYRKKQLEKKVRGYSFILFTGLAFMAVAIYFLIRFHAYPAPAAPVIDPDAMAMLVSAAWM